ncbi:hypothetical protein L7F22_046298 [Adiantum nelumboides]|nr:hypothetical protein [Adiantum nelumboides]
MSQRTIFDAFKKANSRSMNMQAGSSQLRDEVRPQSWNAMMHTLFGSNDEIDVSDVDINEEEMLYVDTNVSPHGLEGAIECSDFVDESDTAEIQRENVKPLKRGKSQHHTNVKVVRKYRQLWEVSYPFLKLVVNGDQELMKCIWCEKYKIKGVWGRGNGCETISKGAIRKHHKSAEHALGRMRWYSEKDKKIPEHVVTMQDRCKDRVVTCMKLAYFIAKQDLAIMKYEALCELAYALDVKEMPARQDYSAYTNFMAGKEFLKSISKFVEINQAQEILLSPVISIMLDESTDRGLEKHLIVYISYLSQGGIGACKTEFLRLVIVSDGCAQTKYDALLCMFSSMGLNIKRLVGIATDGDSSMLGCRDGLVAKLNRDVPCLISVHCVAHREALAVLDACKSLPCLSYIDKIANKIYSWISASSVRHLEFQKLLHEMDIQVLEVLQIHDVRWLARGSVMQRPTKLMPGILSFWKTGARAWYDKLRIYKVLFSIYMLADILHDLNILNKLFQKETADVTSFSTSIEVTLSSLRRKFLSQDFAKDTLFLKDFMQSTKDGVLMHKNEEGVEYVHQLVYACMPGKDKNGIALDVGGGSVDACVAMAKQFVQKVIECINERFLDMYFFNATKLFSPHYYVTDEKEREAKSVLWLSRLLDHLGRHLVDVAGCKRELKAFVDTLYYGCEGMNFRDAWRVFSCTLHWHETFPNFLRLWQILLVLPISSVPCERGFSKQNIIKTDRRQSLKVDTLEMLMRISLLGPDAISLDWEKIYAIWEQIKNQRVSDL